MKNQVLMLLISGLLAAQANSATATTTTDVSSVTIAAKTVDAALTAKLKQPITLDFREAKLCDVAADLEKRLGVNIIVVQEPAATITLVLKNCPLSEVIRYLAVLTGMDSVVEGNAVVFRPKPMDASAGSYKMETSVESAKEPHQYTVAVKIHQSPDGKKWDVLSAPTIVVRAGEEGKVEIKNDKTSDGVECTVLVTEVAAGIVEVSVACKVRETGKPPWQSELKTRIKLP